MRVNTHLKIDPSLVGEPLEVGEGTAVAQLVTQPVMAADERDLVHGGFTFGLADYAAMLAVNDPNVVLGAAQIRFTGPVKVGETLVAKASVQQVDNKKRQVECSVSVGDRTVFQGTFTCFVLNQHIFDQ